MEEKERILQDLKVFLGKSLDRELLKKLSQRDIHITRSDFMDLMQCMASFASMQKFNAVADLAKSMMRENLAKNKSTPTVFDEEQEFSEDLKKI